MDQAPSCSTVQQSSCCHEQPPCTHRWTRGIIQHCQQHGQHVDWTRLAARHTSDAHQEDATRCDNIRHLCHSGRREGRGQPDPTQQHRRTQHRHIAMVHTSQLATPTANVRHADNSECHSHLHGQCWHHV